jgi:hypothetical protein
MWTGIYGKIKFVQQDYLSNYLNSRITPVATNPVYLIEREGFRFYPNDITQARVSYIRQPNTIVFGYTLDGDGLPVYNPATSVDPEWQELDLLEIISRALRMIGVNLQSGLISQYANEITKTGLNAVGIKINDEYDIEIIVERDETYKRLYENDNNNSSDETD